MKSNIIHRIILRSAFLCFLPVFVNGQDKLINILNEEIQREMLTLKQQEIPAYYISYRVDENTTYSISSSFGALTNSRENKSRRLTVTVRVGSPQLDNYHPGRAMSYYSPSYEVASYEDPSAIKQILWSATNDAYQQAVSRFSGLKANIAVKVAEEDRSPDFSLEEPVNSIASPLTAKELKFDVSTWEKRLKTYTAAFLKDPDIFSGTGNFSYEVNRKYFASSSNDKIVQNSTAARLQLSGTIKAGDGMEMPLYESYFAFKPDGLPSDQIISKEINRLIENLTALKMAPVAEPYSGPALLTGKAAGVFFHEIFGHRVEGQRLRNEEDAQTFKKKVNDQVLPAVLSVYDDPQNTVYNKMELSGSYLCDDQGSKGERVNVVQNGILKNFLMTRTLISGFQKSNGHARAASGMQPVSRQSNLIVETSQSKTEKELRNELIRLTKEQNKPYGYLFDEVVGGFTSTGRYMPNAFNVTPTLVYRVYADGRPDEIVRGVDLIGTPLAIFSQIDQAGGEIETFNGFCGAESGSIPVACVSPMIVVRMIETQKKSKSPEKAFILPRPDM